MRTLVVSLIVFAFALVSYAQTGQCGSGGCSQQQRVQRAQPQDLLKLPPQQAPAVQSAPTDSDAQIGRASCRERVYVLV